MCCYFGVSEVVYMCALLFYPYYINFVNGKISVFSKPLFDTVYPRIKIINMSLFTFLHMLNNFINSKYFATFCSVSPTIHAGNAMRL